jgi:hypothetical protein
VSADASSPVAAAAGRLSPRLRIARLAAEAAIATPGVLALRAGPPGVRMTAGAGRRVDGVVVTAAPDGRYQVELHLVCGLVPLPALAEAVRSAVLMATAEAGLGDAVGPVHVRVEEIADA